MEATADQFPERVLDHIEENLADDEVRQALQSGVDLRDYSRQVESQLDAAQALSIQDYLGQAVNIARLHRQIKDCDSVLERMEAMLCEFQSDLGNMSQEIQQLQQESVRMNVKLKNRQAVRGELSQFVDEMVVPEQMISHILDTPVTERQFLEQLHELNHKINFVKEQSYKEARSCADVRDILEKLKLKAISKIRDFLMQKIYSFRKPMTNYQNAQNTMLKYRSFYQFADQPVKTISTYNIPHISSGFHKNVCQTTESKFSDRFFNEFLINNERHVAKEVSDEYLDTTSKMYYSYFKEYQSRLMKLQFNILADRDDVMGMEEPTRRSLFSSRQTLRNKATVFSLGSRGAVVGADLEAPIIIPHAAQLRPLQASTRSSHAVSSYCPQTTCRCTSCCPATALNMFNLVMGKTLSLFRPWRPTSLSRRYRSVPVHPGGGPAICTGQVPLDMLLMSRDFYWTLMSDLIWPRFTQLVQSHTLSVARSDPSKFSHLDTRPHPVLRRYAEFICALLSVTDLGSGATGAAPAAASAAPPVLASGEEASRLRPLLGELRDAVDAFLQLPALAERLICLINNYDIPLTVLSEALPDEAALAGWLGFREPLARRVAEFVEELLCQEFGLLVNFVREERPGARRRPPGRRVAQVVRDFNANWKANSERMNQQIMASFTQELHRGLPKRSVQCVNQQSTVVLVRHV
uniref:Vacuolar protein sorting-associated protein 52 homolog n=1 Tax=Macrostomum lignano TaxID=282301 RepID=A0A1I8GX19_9PLAT